MLYLMSRNVDSVFLWPIKLEKHINIMELKIIDIFRTIFEIPGFSGSIFFRFQVLLGLVFLGLRFSGSLRSGSGSRF